MREFEGKLVRPTGVGTWTYVNVPFDVEEAFGAKGQVRVRGTVNGAEFRSSLRPHGDGTHYLVVGGELREMAGVTGAGDAVQVALEKDTEERTVETPADLLAALAERPEALAFYEGLAYSGRKEYVAWIESAKRAETRRSRIDASVVRLSEGRKLKS
ncbi:YdeI/OmpD-associated family protein [Cohnella sp. REN36]|uniref:YdeI/OmpD-associated family protein n=1 Tax=Cohnella sp. REN36 TaxID=2887347 RepID=UPI001D153180|nr:YdeI/OmpD-associated family protein [Cohnella sp. REN36]